MVLPQVVEQDFRHADIAFELGDTVLPVDGALKELFPEGGLRRGGVFALSGGTATTSLLFALLGSALAKGSWGAVLGMASLGVEAAAGYEVPLSRLLLIPHLGATWLETTAVVLSSCDVVVVCPPQRCSAQVARQLATRARVHDAVLLVVPPMSFAQQSKTPWEWPVPVDGRLDVVSSQWCGLRSGDGTLTSRHVELRYSGRRAGTRERGLHCWLPSPTGAFASTSSVAAENDSVTTAETLPFVARRSG